MGGLGVFAVLGMFLGYAFTDAPSSRVDIFGLDYFSPSKEDRQIQTFSTLYFAREKQFSSLPLTLRLGGMVSHADGEITQLKGEWENGTLHAETMNSPGNGIGPVVEANFRLWQGNMAWQPTLSVDLLTGVLIYDRRFPAGGDFYNGTFQGGLGLQLSPSPKDKVEISVRAMHTSNGQGVNQHNPGYNANGVSLRWAHSF